MAPSGECAKALGRGCPILEAHRRRLARGAGAEWMGEPVDVAGWDRVFIPIPRNDWALRHVASSENQIPQDDLTGKILVTRFCAGALMLKSGSGQRDVETFASTRPYRVLASSPWQTAGRPQRPGVPPPLGQLFDTRKTGVGTRTLTHPPKEAAKPLAI